MKTPATEQFPEIEWEEKQLLEHDIEERSQTWEMEGEDSNENKYSGVGEFICGELVVINQIESK